MQKYFDEITIANENGLYLVQIPTGSGKTYQTVQFIKSYDLQNLTSEYSKRKILFLTTMNKNIPVDELEKAFGEDYENKVLHLRANRDEVYDKLESLNVPDEWRTNEYYLLLDKLKKYKDVEKQKSEFKQDYEKDFSDAEKRFRKHIQRELKSRFLTKQERLDVIKTNSKFKWIGELYPAVFTDEYNIFLMTVSKFLKRNSTLIEESYQFLNSELVNNSIIFIDEFDATKKTITSEIIEKSVGLQQEYINFFVKIKENLDKAKFSTKLRISAEKAQSKNSLDNLIKKANEIYEKYRLELDYKTVSVNATSNQNFLFHDSLYHSILSKGKSYIRTNYNESKNRIDIFFEDRETYYKNKDSNISIQSMLRDVNNYLIAFRYFLFLWAKEYTILENKERAENKIKDKFTEENAANTILNKLGFNDDEKEIILSELINHNFHPEKKQRLPDLSFYNRGFEVFSFVDDDNDNERTELNFNRIANTAEKILVNLCQNNIVIGMSATAQIPTCIGNYDLNYLERILKDKFHPFPKEASDRIQKELEPLWDVYKDNIEIYANRVFKNLEGCENAEEFLSNKICNEHLAKIISNKINTTVSTLEEKEFVINRYCNLFWVMNEFINNNEINSFLYLSQRLTRFNSAEFDRNLIQEIFGLLNNNNDKNKIELTFLSGDDYEDAKKDILEWLEKGKKIFIMSAYATISAGQNLQHGIFDKTNLVYIKQPIDENDKRFFTKDIDAIYLGDTTNLTVNISTGEPLKQQGLFELLFQIKEVDENNELLYEEIKQMLENAFAAKRGGAWKNNLLYNTESVRLQATQQIMQAVGRLSRSYVKNKNIYIYIEDGALEKLSVNELKKHILVPEMQRLVELKESLGVCEKCDDSKRIIAKAEKTSRETNHLIHSYLKNPWTENSILQWKKLREIVLKYPTCNFNEIESIDEETKEIIMQTYITDGTKRNCYLFSQSSDFSNVFVSFDLDKLKFKEQRRKSLENIEPSMIQTMCEEETRLQTCLKYSGMKDFFKKNNYACNFEQKGLLMSPPLFHNIYKGALGEVCGKFILEKELGIVLKEIEDFEKFEFFDFELSESVYVDFKNWKSSFVQSREKTLSDIQKKLDEIGGKKVFIINVVGSSDYTPKKSTDGKIIEIPALIDSDGKIILDNFRKIKTVLENDNGGL